ncbi:aefR-like transcriptional repressor domain protein [Acinetobacter sp. 1461402]|nr:aefR-like transcriptional repressor domain protein [Acinetobacter sp. 1461402]
MYTELLLSLLLGIRHQHVLLGMQPVPDQQERDCMIQQSIELFLLRYQVRSSPP